MDHQSSPSRLVVAAYTFSPPPNHPERLASTVQNASACSFETIDVSGNDISDDGAAAYAGALGRLTGLTVLNVSDDSIGDRGGKSLGKVIERLPKLRTLNLGKNRFDLLPIVDSISTLGELCELNIGGVQISDGSSRTLVRALRSTDTLAKTGWIKLGVSKTARKIDIPLQNEKKKPLRSTQPAIPSPMQGPTRDICRSSGLS